MMDDQTTVWLKSLQYLPPPLRDFHDQKEVFKTIHQITNVDGHEYARSVDWVTGQCYVIDIFLWFMARRGYTLQRCRARVPFRALHADVEEARNRRGAALPLPSAAQPTTSAKE
ncbi:phage-related hypothetical protein [Bordetella bronchiseptica RB50]|uniref:Uncharacterized protein n=2 Tax=Bordetella bronchiseptica TaxID=518 RepID=A0A0H3LTI8_BORBR|nr:hypothetical protein L491_1711 [Bordetella bronchiseptica 3E44]KCV63185.1 hypothetical protein AZ14_1693 [Bordetella bronchiseptica 980]KDB58500.1 hypothetical protein AZ15_1869 [Bordetella bronchiseptica A1-7]CAE32167.1 phage-related hypothetical protein [Bordetella bronchiseptica RB50]